MFDIHCHFFTKNVFTQSLFRLEKYIASLESTVLPTSIIGQRNSEIIFDALNTAKKTPLEMYQEMSQAYGEDFIAVPLMLDLSYTFIAPKDKVYQHKKSLLKTMQNSKIKSQMTDKSDWINEIANSFDKRLDKLDRSVALVDVFENSYLEQIKDLTEVKNQLPNHVFPFFSIDPRRDDEFEGGVLSEIKKYVGPDKTFAGLKLYTSLGYSPTHPVLYDDGVYAYCEKHGIPITVHASLEGFSHMLDENFIEGDVYYSPAGKVVPADHIYDKGIVTYNNNFTSLSFAQLTRERLLLLNHPLLWRKVLVKHPKLKLNMAHFGGIIQMSSFVKGNQTAFYAPYIIEMMRDFENVYTDMSCLYNYDGQEDYMKRIYETLYLPLDESIKDRVMYGSDYYMLKLFESDLSNYLGAFKAAFGKDFARISIDNPKRFLFGMD